MLVGNARRCQPDRPLVNRLPIVIVPGRRPQRGVAPAISKLFWVRTSARKGKEVKQAMTRTKQAGAVIAAACCVVAYLFFASAPASGQVGCRGALTRLRVKDASGVLGQVITIEAQLINFDNGKPLARQPVDFYLGFDWGRKQYLGTRYTDSKGVARLLLVVQRYDYPRWWFSIVAHYRGNCSQYRESWGYATVSILMY
jgi:hypothetical protein